MRPIDRQTIFIVDDDEDDQFLIQHAFLRFLPGCRLELLGNGVELLGKLELVPYLPALILLDVNMPYLGGFETLEQLREHPLYKSLPVVMLTTSNQAEDRQRAFLLGAKDFITKPFELRGYQHVLLGLFRDYGLTSH
ncbi:response regulator [Larkinella insperata]|uniref:Response regulator n=1 Tax=Larkinella insperata TaxID=332158 RepID=A0ABW3QHZ2_9BACT